MVPTIEWRDGTVRLLDQSRLPGAVEFLDCRDYREVADAIRELKVRGAPAIGVTAALGIALGAQSVSETEYRSFSRTVRTICDQLAATRPTAVNLFWAIERMKQKLDSLQSQPIPWIKQALIVEAQAILDEDIGLCRAMGRHGAELIKDGQTVLTHCNAGALATAGYGTALGVIRAAWDQGKKINVIADETRPVLQGSRLTAWELMQDKIPVTLITDNMAGSLMRLGKIHLCVVGADRIAANGDVANKIGTYSHAIAARHHGVKVMVVAPSSTVDMATADGDHIEIEMRDPAELLAMAGVRTVADGVEAWNPVFDVTPAGLIDAIVTERGVVESPDRAKMVAVFGAKSSP
ncbi:MAG: S-methyl-5-thioribose-1-phosphate isomerase [Nitrospira sp. ST-bin4]|nr:MAG: S-methyl-5-thioribose-1-phosphate isomerase [Nitrospira sp. ST-bin4]